MQSTRTTPRKAAAEETTRRIEPVQRRRSTTTPRSTATTREERPESTSRNRQRSRRPTLAKTEAPEVIQSSTVYAPRPFVSSRAPVADAREDVTYPRSRTRGTARFSNPTISGTRTVNFENQQPVQRNVIRRRGPSRAFTSEDNEIALTTVEKQPLTTRGRPKASSKQDEGPLNFLVPDRAINPNNRFTLTSNFGGNKDTTSRTIVEEVFDINTANPNVLSRNQFGELSQQPFLPSVADIKEDTVILTLGGQLAVSSPAQNSLQTRINEELAKLDGSDTVAPYSVTISSLAPESDFDYETQTASRLASVGTTRLTPLDRGRTRLTTVKKVGV